MPEGKHSLLVSISTSAQKYPSAARQSSSLIQSRKQAPAPSFGLTAQCEPIGHPVAPAPPMVQPRRVQYPPGTPSSSVKHAARAPPSQSSSLSQGSPT